MGTKNLASILLVSSFVLAFAVPARAEEPGGDATGTGLLEGMVIILVVVIALVGLGLPLLRAIQASGAQRAAERTRRRYFEACRKGADDRVVAEERTRLVLRPSSSRRTMPG